MSDTPRNDESPEYRDPTAPSDPSALGRLQHVRRPDGSIDYTSPIETNETPRPAGRRFRRAPAGSHRRHRGPRRPARPARPACRAATGGQPAYGPPGAAPQNPYAAPPAGAGAPPPPHNPYAGAPGTGQPNPYGGQQYPTQGQVQGGYPRAAMPALLPTARPRTAPRGYGAPTYAAPQSLSGNTIALLVVSGLTTLGCGFGIVAPDLRDHRRRQEGPAGRVGQVHQVGLDRPRRQLRPAS